jgi:hypothetical protein
MVNDTTLLADHDFFGILPVKVVVTDGYAVSEEFVVDIEVTENAKPIITATDEFLIEKNETVEFSLNNVTVTDADDTEIALEVRPGDNYTVSGTIITPAVDFTGNLMVSLVANDGFQNSDPLDVTVQVVELITETENQNDKISVYPSPADNLLFIHLYSEGNSFSMYDILGKKMLSGNLRNGKNALDLQCFKGGVYLLKIVGQRTIRVIKK